MRCDTHPGRRATTTLTRSCCEDVQYLCRRCTRRIKRWLWFAGSIRCTACGTGKQRPQAFLLTLTRT